MFKPLASKANVQDVENSQLEFWKENDVFKKTIEDREGCPDYVIYEGPPTANGMPGTHHVLARAFKDMFPRYKTMKGFKVLRKGGWDTHGLPVEIAVERELGFEHKWQIEEYGVGPFNEKCRDSVFRNIKDWEVLTERIAYWTDLDEAYVTFKDEYIESVWWILRNFWDKDLIYRGFKVVPYCPRCGTPLSSHEVNQGYVDNTPDPSIFVKFKLEDKKNEFFLVWTTTPWTLPGNVALAIGEDIEYVKVKGANPEGETEVLILAKERLEYALEERNASYTVIDEMKGKDLLGLRYERLYTFLPVEKECCYVLSGDFVSTEEGTGIVHIAPAFGADDMNIGRKHDLPTLQTVAEDGTFIEAVKPWAGVWVKDADKQIIEELYSRGLMFKDGIYHHTYPFCWRCNTPLLYYARPTWYIETTKKRDQLVNLNKTINWVPDHIRDGRFGNWLEGNIDWALGRERYWGTPLPIWQCDNPDCDHEHLVNSRAELSEFTGEDLSELDLHRPYVDEITWTCPECNKGTMRRIPELIDVWFDSGSMPVAQWGYPNKNKEMFESQFPADYICEAIDQTRGWFYSLHAISTLLFDEICFKNVICLGLILDEEGKKMSKSRGNVVNPWDVLDKYGADMFRWYMYTAGPPGEMRRFSVELVGQSFRSFWLTLWNTYSFFITYANLDGFDPSKSIVSPTERSPLDRWILSELNALIDKVTNAYEKYDASNATRPIERFVNDLSNWYLRRSRRRFWKSENDSDKDSAYHTLYEVLVTLSKLLAPSIPFFSEELYRNLVASIDQDAPISVHLADWPRVNNELIDEKLNEEMQIVMKLVSLGHATRNSAQVKVRQPLGNVAFSLPSESAHIVEKYREIISEELNVKNVDILAGSEEVVSYSLNPLPKALGPRFGKEFPKIQKYLRDYADMDFAKTLLAGKAITFDFNREAIEISPDEVEVMVSPKEGFAIAEEMQYLAALNTKITEDLAKEGLAREFIRRAQVLRREADYNVDDRISISYQASTSLENAVAAYSELIMAETLATELRSVDTPEGDQTESYEFDGESLTLAVKK